jgi:hypothetical protein
MNVGDLNGVLQSFDVGVKLLLQLLAAVMMALAVQVVQDNI